MKGVLQWNRAVIRSRVSVTAKAVAACLITYADPDGSNCRPALATIADDLAVSLSTVKRAVRELDTAGLLTRDERPGHATLYVMQTQATSAPLDSSTRVTHDPPPGSPMTPDLEEVPSENLGTPLPPAPDEEDDPDRAVEAWCIAARVISHYGGDWARMTRKDRMGTATAVAAALPHIPGELLYASLTARPPQVVQNPTGLLKARVRAAHARQRGVAA